jgi:hypothetical protein
MNYLHIGLGKTGTTFLQNEIFPQISNKLGLAYIPKKEFFNIFPPSKNMIRKIIHSYNFTKSENKNFKMDSYFLSVENLCGKLFNPLFWKKSAKINNKIFGNNVNIIITLSKPSDFISSIYCHNIQSYNFQKENEFFLNHASSLKFLKNKKEVNFFDIELFDYKYLLKSYLNNFESVIVLKKEDISNKEILSKIFDNNQINEIKFTNRLYNKSYSKFSVNLSFNIDKFLKFFSLSLKKTDMFARNLNNLNITNKFLKKIVNKLSIELRWRFFIQNRLDKFFKFKKYEILDPKIKSSIQDNEKFYKNLKSGKISFDDLN